MHINSCMHKPLYFCTYFCVYVIKGRGTRDQLDNVPWIIEKARGFQKNIYLCFIAKAFHCVDHNELWKALKETTILPVSWETCICGTRSGTTDWFRTKKGVWQGCLLSSWLCNLYTEHILKNAGPGRWKLRQAEIKISRKNINNLRYAYDTTLTAESEEN